MAATIFRAAARKVFRDASGRFTSKAKYELSQRRSLATGRFLTRSDANTERDLDRGLRKILGKAPQGWSWARVANRYEERFAGLVSEVIGG